MIGTLALGEERFINRGSAAPCNPRIAYLLDTAERSGPIAAPLRRRDAIAPLRIHSIAALNNGVPPVRFDRGFMRS